MTRGRATRGLGGLLLLGGVAFAAPLPALAQNKGPVTSASSDAPQTEDQIKAQQHFQRAKDLYQQGAYRDALTELETARALDPKAKDLVFNIGIVNEKLAKYDEAIAAFQKFVEMDGVTNAEKQKAESIIKRIEGAKREVPTAQPTSTAPPPPTSRPEPEKPPPHGRVDVYTIAAGGVSLVGFGVGIGFGLRALGAKPKDFVTGRDGTYADLQATQDDAHGSAVIADVGFAVGIVGAIAAAYLYFSRTRDPKPHSTQGTTKPTAVSVGPLGRWLVLGGSFQ